MGKSITGQWSQMYTAPYSGAAKWGTGVNPIHSFYGEEGDPLRVYGRPVDREVFGGVHPHPGRTAPFQASPDFIDTEDPWGYAIDDIAGLDVFQLSDPVVNRRGLSVVNDTDHPNLVDTGNGRDVPNTGDGFNEPNRADASRYRVPVGIPGRETSGRIRAGQWDEDQFVSDQVPTETVNEGWLNKPASGMGEGADADAVVVSDPAQYERQTSMQQRFAVQSNDRALLRMTDDPRQSISSRVVPMRLKVYSEGQRNYDMFPFQMDDIPRPFWFRRAGLGRRNELLPNEMYVIDPIQRTPPPDPSLGSPEETLSDPNSEVSYGYTSEDQGWY